MKNVVSRRDVVRSGLAAVAGCGLPFVASAKVLDEKSMQTSGEP